MSGRVNALAVWCRYCNAQEGEPCRNQAVAAKPIKRAHPERIKEALAALRALTTATPGKGREP